MMDKSWDPWKVTALGLALIMATALVTGLVVANWSGSSPESEPRIATGTRPAQPARTTTVKPSTPQVVQAAPATPAVPTQEAVDACNRYAASQVGEQNKTQEVVKDAAIGTVVGAAVGAAGGAVAGGGKGTLYGLNENKQHDEHYRTVYSSCMRSRGYTAG